MLGDTAPHAAYTRTSMAYTVLARRYRSGTFDEVIGQDHVAQTLKRAIQSSRIAHAFMFTGTRGVGKTSMARILAKALNCHVFPAATITPCGTCDSCQAIAKGEDIDVIEIDAASNTGVDNVRDIIENARFRPARSRFKVYIIDEVHMLSKAAFNALLKIMEEPPEHVKFILATTEAEKVLPTILSRCQRFDFRNIPTREIVQHLRHIVKEEGVESDDEALTLVARAGAGSMRDALSLLDRLLSVGEKRLTTDSIEQLLGMPRASAIFELAASIGKGDAKQTLTQANKLINNGLAADTLVAALTDHFHNLLLINTCGSASDLVDIAGLNKADVDAQAMAFDAVSLVQNIAVLEELRRQLRGSMVGRALLDACFVRLALSAQFARIDELIGEVNEIEAAGEKKKPLAGEASSSREVRPPQKPPEQMSAPATVVETTSTNNDHSEDDSEGDGDALPAVGKVAPAEAQRSIFAAFKNAPTRANKPAPKPAPTPAPKSTIVVPTKPSEIAVATALHQTDNTVVWAEVLGHFKQASPGTAALLSNGRLEAIEGDVVTLGFEYANAGSGSMLHSNKEKRQAVAEQFARVIGRPVQVEIRTEEASRVLQESRPEQATSSRQAKPSLKDVQPDEADNRPTVDMSAIESHPLIALLKEKFDAKVVRVEAMDSTPTV